MNNAEERNSTTGIPQETFGDERQGKAGGTFPDTNAESDARDQAKLNKVAARETQKMDGGNPYADEDSVSDEEIRRETLEKK